jgi:penicillin-binding protein 1B
VRSYFLDNRQTLSRKIKEAIMAMLLEVHFDKQDLMNAYINEIWLGQDGNRAIHGYGLASQFYFGKPLSELDVHEIALLVAVTRGPSYYNPRRHPERARARRDMVIKLLEQFQVISPQTAKRAIAKPLGITHPSKNAGGYYPAFLDMVRRTLRRDYRDEDLTEAGLRIFATLNPFVQAKAEEALTKELARLDKTQKGKHSGPLEGVVVVTSPQNGEVVALVGGRQTGFSGFNRALDAKRSIGSLVKPVIYLAAIQSGQYHAATVIEDGPVEVKLANGKVWRPHNIDQRFMGPVPLVKALSKSLNLATVNLGLDVGLPQVAHEFQLLGLEREPPQVPALLLGAIDLSPVEVAQLFNGFANGGFRARLRAVRAVVDAQGKPLKSFGLEVEPVADPGAVYQLNRMLVQVMERGTGRGVRGYLPPEIVVAGKTGTSSDYRDAWFAGFSGSHLAVVWIGYDDNSSTRLTGATGALPVWARVMKAIGTRPWNALPPENVDEVWVNYDTGFAVTPECGMNPVLIAVPKGTELALSSGCATSAFENLGERTREWWRRIIR